MSIDLPNDFVYPPGFVQPQTVEEMGNQLRKLTFPDGFACYVQSQPAEAALIYNEIVVKQEYFQNGLSVAGARCVIDIGANVGIFTMTAKRNAPDAVIYAVEAIPDTFHVLERNVDLLGGSDVHVYNLAMGSQDHGEMTFTFYPNMPGNSTANRALKDDNKPVMDQVFGKEVADFLYQAETRTVPVRTLSSLIREHGISSIDFLKVEVEGAEISVLDGIEETHWSIIKQIAVEAHTPGLQEQVRDTLIRHGFQVYTDLGLSAAVTASLVYGRR